MKLKGELDSIGVAELFKTLGEQRATGILIVSSPMGQKTIALSMGEIAVCSDNLSERTRLGDLLIARGKITDEQLSHALKTQRLDPRSKLGDVMVKQGIASVELIAEAVRFQVEEQITDLFTWKEATFEFDSDRPIDDAFDPDGSGNPVQRLSISTQPLMADIAKKMENWKQIQDRIPTPYLCFKITPKGEELVTKAPKNTQSLIKLLKEGRTLETSIKKSCMGRMNVCNNVVKLLDDAWIFPVPGNELRFLASEHRFKKRFLDALYIYRRLRDTAQSETDRAELEKQIQDTIDAIQVAAAAGETAEGSEIVSYKDAAERYRRRQRIRRIAMAVFGAAAIFIISFLLLRELAPKGTLPEDYMNAIKKSDKLVEEHKFLEAMNLWAEFIAKMPDKGGDTFNSASERRAQIDKQERSYYDSLKHDADTAYSEAMKSSKTAAVDLAEKKYQRIIDEFAVPEGSKKTEAQDRVKLAEIGLAKIKEWRIKTAETKLVEDQKASRQVALDLLNKKDYAKARISLHQVLDTLPPGSELRGEVEDGLKKILEIEDRARRLMETARQQIENKQGETAIDTLVQVYQEWTDVPGADDARAKRSDLQMRLSNLKMELARGLKAEKDDNAITALEILRQAQTDYPEFEQTAEVRKHVDELTGKMAVIDKQLAEAQDVLKSGDREKAILLFTDLIQKYFAYLAVKNVKLPIHVSSTPIGAVVKLDGKEAGRTPCDITLPIGAASTVTIELAGYETCTRKYTRLVGEDLHGFQTTLRRGAMKIVKLAGGIYAPPRIIDGVLYVFHGDSISLLDPKLEQPPRTAKKLFDIEANTRPNSSGNGENVAILDKTWWCPRAAPEPFANGKVLLMLRSRDVTVLDTSPAVPTPDKLLTLPTEPVGAPYFDADSLLGGAPLLAVGCADGKIYIYDLNTKQQISGSPILADPRPQVGKSASLATGLVARGMHTFVSLSTTGYMQWFTVHNGKALGAPLDLKGEPGADIFLPGVGENLAAFVMKEGRLVVVDLEAHQELWHFTPPPGEEITRAVVSADGIYVLNRKAGSMEIRKYERFAPSGPPKLIWGPRGLDSETDLPLVVGKALFACSNLGTIYAFSRTTGEHIWDYQTGNRPSAPSQMTVIGDLLYVAFPTGEVMILNGN